MIGTTLKHFRITARLGAGGMGEVYRAEDTRLGREVAIKVLPGGHADDPARVERFAREARALAALSHPGVAAVHEIGEVDGIRFIVMELVPGATLAEQIDRGPLPFGEAMAVAIEIARALEAAHAAGIIHRDLKPQNLKLTPEGRVKVLDFGLARLLSGEPGELGEQDDGHAGPSETVTAAADLTRTGTIVGTAAYMSPEQVRGEQIDARTDIWALGCVLFEMLASRQAFGAATPQDCLAAVLAEEPPWHVLPSDLPPAVVGPLRRCLRKRPDERLHAVADVRIGLEDAMAIAETAPTRAEGGRLAVGGRHRLLAAAATVVIVVAAFTLGILLPRPGAGSSPPLRAVILPPEGTTFELHPVFPGPAVVSPDGSAIVFAARNEEGLTRLWVRPLAEATARPLAGTEGATFPFWSPDSRFVAYVVDGRLERIPVAGGPAIGLTRTRIRSGGTWSERGVILVTAADDAIHQVPAGGGESEPVTEVDRRGGEDRHVHPRFLPDGERFLFLALDRQVDQGRGKPVFLASLSGTAPREVLRSTSHVEYAAGHVWYVRDGVLMAQSFAAERGEATGPPVPVGEGAISSAWAAYTGAGYFSVSPAGVIAYHARGTATRRSVLTWYGPDGTSLGSVGEPEYQYHVSLSPDGSRALLQMENPDGRGYDLWAYELGPGRTSRVTFRPNSAVPVWSPTGERIAFDSDRTGHLEIYLKTLGHDDAEPLFPQGLPAYADPGVAGAATVGGAFPLDWSPDGRHLVYCTWYEGRRPDLWTVRLDDRSRPLPLQQSPFREEDAAISPDGRWLAYTSDASGRDEVYVAPFPAGGPARQVSIDGGIRPEWNPRGGELFFLSTDYTLMSATVASGEDDPRVGAVVPRFRVDCRPHVFAEPGIYAVVPDGERFLVNRVVETDAPSHVNLIVGWTDRLDQRPGE